ncbi:PucR family transcriptional regulator [Arthrobacter sp. MA-N2]|uniref:PucR family transcriptional regulator n=1 Tax=Arthrobacter sp. MA-N2 TaxID=1101188 RepID=UPI00047F933D|nr:helix-turn-helix domain-containing protein [Arthrobacter sp. MA-N2]
MKSAQMYTADLCSRALADQEAIAQAITRKIRFEVPAYGVVPFEDHVQHVGEQQFQTVTLLGERRTPTAVEVGRAAALGRLRAAQGVSVEAVIGAFFIGSRETWKLLDKLATPEERPYLPELVTLMWENVGLLTPAIAEAHASVSQAAVGREVVLQQRLVDRLMAGSLGAETGEIATALGFDVNATFSAIVTDTVTEDLMTVRSVVSALPGTAVLILHEDTVVALTQRTDLTRFAARFRERLPAVRLGVGIDRRGLEGAAESIVDARLALAIATSEQPVRLFATGWWEALLRSERERLLPLVVEGRELVAEKPHLVEAVRSFAQSGFSVTLSANALHVHPNTMAYRLERWKDLTGWDARTFDGLMISLLAADSRIDGN